MFPQNLSSVPAVSPPSPAPVSPSVRELGKVGRIRAQEDAQDLQSEPSSEQVSSTIGKVLERVSTFWRPAVESRTPEKPEKSSAGHEVSPSALRYENLETSETPPKPEWPSLFKHGLEVSLNMKPADVPDAPQPPLSHPFSTPKQSVGHHPEEPEPRRSCQSPGPSGFSLIEIGEDNLCRVWLWNLLDIGCGISSSPAVASLLVRQWHLCEFASGISSSWAIGTGIW